MLFEGMELAILVDQYDVLTFFGGEDKRDRRRLLGRGLTG